MGTRWEWCCPSKALVCGCCRVQSGKLFWGNISFLGGRGRLVLASRPQGPGTLRGPGAPARPGLSSRLPLSRTCFSTAEPPRAQPPLGAGDAGCAPSPGGRAGSPWGSRAILGTPRDVAPCHRHPALTWQEPPARGKPALVHPTAGTAVLPAGPLLLPASSGGHGGPAAAHLPPAQLRQRCAANMWPGRHRCGAIRAGGRQAQPPRDGRADAP